MSNSGDSGNGGSGNLETVAGGGIGWKNGSLVGSENPENKLGYRYSNPQKRYRLANQDNEDGKGKVENGTGPSSVVVQFQNREGTVVGERMDMPTDVNVHAMSKLIHKLLHPEDDDDDNKDKTTRKRKLESFVPYTFFAKLRRAHPDKPDETFEDEVEMTSPSLADFLQRHGVSSEQVLSLVYQPLSLRKVRPVTRCTDTMVGHEDAVLHVSYSPDGQHLASGGGDGHVRFWNVRTSLPQHCGKGAHKNHVLCTAWSPDGQQFVSADQSGVLIAWDYRTGTAKAKIPKAHKRWITSMAWEPLHTSPTSTSERLATASKDGLVKVWNIRTRQCVATLSGHTDSVECVKWGGEDLLYTASRDRTIKVWNTKEESTVGKLVKTLSGHAHRVNTLALSCDYICRTGPFSFSKSELAGDSPQQEARRRYQEFMTTGGGSPERLVSGSDDYTLFFWTPHTSKHATKRLTGHQQLVNHLSFSPDARFVASASFDKKVKVWSGRSGEFLATLTGHVSAVYQVSWSADSRFLVSASKDSTARLWTVGDWKRARETLPGHADEVYALDWSPAGASVATGSKDRTIKIWKH